MKQITLSTTAKAIRDSFPEFLDALAKSTAMAPWEHELRCDYDPRTKQQKIEDAVRSSFGVLPPNRPVRELVGIVSRRIKRDFPAFGLNEEPCDKTIRKYTREIAAEKKRNFGAEVPHGSIPGNYSASTQFSSTLQST